MLLINCPCFPQLKVRPTCCNLLQLPLAITVVLPFILLFVKYPSGVAHLAECMRHLTLFRHTIIVLQVSARQLSALIV